MTEPIRSPSTLIAVLKVSNGRSITSKIAIASSGMPTDSKTICIPDMEAVGMPGAPIDEIMAIRNTVMTITVESSMPYR